MESHDDRGHGHGGGRPPEGKAVELQDLERLDLDPEVHGRLLAALNAARRHEDLTDIEACGADHELCQAMLRRRRQLGPQGFTDIKQLIGLPRFNQDLLEKLLHWFGPARYGEWEMKSPTVLYGQPYPVAHAAVLRSGKVLFLPEDEFHETLLWDPDTDTIAQTADVPSDWLFCSGHSFLSNGDLLCVGGGGGGPSGVNRAWRFNPDTNRWTKTAGDMGSARWYPTAVTIPNRKVLVVGGSPATNTTDIYDEYSDSFTPMGGPASTRSFPQLYPGLHLLPGGEVFYSRTGFGSAGQGPGGGDPVPTNAFLRFSAPSSGEWVELTDTMEHTDRVRGMSVLLLNRCNPTVSVVVIGGTQAPGSGTAEQVKLSTLTPDWGHAMTVPDGSTRINVNAVLLPDGTVFVVGGTSDPAVPCARYNPANGQWQTMARANYRKQYHSVAVLLPSGRVLATGGSNYGGGANVIEVFSPPYLFTLGGGAAARPTIANAPASMSHTGPVQIESPDAAQITSIVLVRPMAVTHQTDSEQRRIELDFHRHGNTLHAHMPHGHSEPGLAPLGYYMLFILKGRVPSTARFIRLT